MKTYIYPQNMKTKAKLWFWTLRDAVIIGVALTLAVISFARLSFTLPLVLTAIYAFMTLKLDETSVLDYIRRAYRFFISTQQTFYWRENRK